MVNDSHRDFVITSKILQEIKDIKTFTEGISLEEYLDDLKTQKAVAMSLINIGELCGAYSQGFLRSTDLFHGVKYAHYETLPLINMRRFHILMYGKRFQWIFPN